MTKTFFVVLYDQSGTRLSPVCEDNGALMVYATREDAVHAAQTTALGEQFGYDIFEAGHDAQPI